MNIYWNSITDIALVYSTTSTKKYGTTTKLMLVAMADHICHPLLPSTQNMAYKKPNIFGIWIRFGLKFVKVIIFYNM